MKSRKGCVVEDSEPQISAELQAASVSVSSDETDAASEKAIFSKVVESKKSRLMRPVACEKVVAVVNWYVAIASDISGTSERGCRKPKMC